MPSGRFRYMRNLILILLLTTATALPALATMAPGGDDDEPVVPSAMRNPYRGYSWRVDEEGDTMMVIFLRDLTVFPAERFKNRRDEEHYWRTVRDVKLTLPYAKLIAETLLETYEYIETFPTQAEREQYLKDMESSLFQQYKPVLKRFSRRQAKVLIKLIQRETHQTSYDIVRAFLGTFRATFWQGFGRLFGVSLRSEYKPATNADDARLERIATLVEQGSL